MVMGAVGGFKRQLVAAKEREFTDSQHVITRCAHCPDWKHEGLAAEGRAAAARHQREKHPQRPKRRRSRSP